MKTFNYESEIPRSAEEVFAWHERPGAFYRLTPPWQKVKVLSATKGIQSGSEVTALIKVGPLWMKWVMRHEQYIKGRQFHDRLVKGYFKYWLHKHLFIDDEEGGMVMRDTIEYAFPMGVIGRCLDFGYTPRMLKRMFRYRHQILREDLVDFAQPTDKKLRIAVTGASGFVGSALIPFLRTQGHEVLAVSRNPKADIVWDPAAGKIDAEKFEGLDVIINLAGENIMGLWTQAKRKRIYESRIRTTELLVEVIGRLKKKPGLLLNASAIGFNAGNGVEASDETSPAGSGFLAEVCRDWEAAARGVEQWGVRAVMARIGLVLSPGGGALAKMLPAFKMCLGGRIGDGWQQYSWVAMDDVIGGMYHCVLNEEIRGPVNLVAPEPVSNMEFTRSLAAALKRPAILPVPAFLLKALLGEMGKNTVLLDCAVRPEVLQRTGYVFRHKELDSVFALYK